MVLLYCAELMYKDYVVTLRIKWPSFQPEIAKIRSALLKLLAELRGLVSFGPRVLGYGTPRTRCQWITQLVLLHCCVIICAEFLDKCALIGRMTM